jgi:peptidoglycan/LPS O-acetylase OafA/YrhL
MTVAAPRPKLRRSTNRTTGRLANPHLRADIQGLRMVAVVAVILDHLLGWPSGGFVGVDMFFVISGFLITGLLLREYERTGTISFSQFYRNRIRRIAPAATLVIVVTVFAAWLVFNSARFASTANDAVWSMLFAANWGFAASGTDYFQASGPESPLQHFWSLAVEEQFYFVWPWLMLLALVLVQRKQKSASLHQLLPWVAVVLVGLIATSFTWALLETRNAPTWAYFSTLSRGWELGIGALLAVILPVLTNVSSTAKRLLVYGGSVGVLISFVLIDDSVPFPAPWAVLPVLATAAIIAGGTGATVPFWPLTNRVSGYVGDISYSLYLWHFPVIIIGGTVLGEGTGHRLLLLGVLTVAAVYSFHLVEDPIRRSNWLKKPGSRRSASAPLLTSPRYQAAGVSLLFLVTVTVALGALQVQAPRAAVALPPRAVADSSQEDTTPVGPELAAVQDELRQALQATAWPDLDPSLESVMAGKQAQEDIARCGFDRFDEAACTWGDQNAPRTAVIVGNSIAMTYAGPLREVLRQEPGWKLLTYGMFGCQFADYSDYQGAERPDGCEERPGEAVEAISRLQADVVFVAGILTAENAERQLAGIEGSPTIVVLPQPPHDKDIKECYSRTGGPADCIGGIPAGWADEEEQLAARVEGMFIDTSGWFCIDGYCPAFAGRIPTKMDITHLSPDYGLRLAPVMREAFSEFDVLAVSGPE